MKYLKLFEAFDSNILNKTLGFIKDRNEKESFVSLLRNIFNSIDFPFSKISDEYFDYLPFQKALEKSNMSGDEPCEATSEKEFPQYAVEGAKCEGGLLKRKWGSRVRQVECPVCNGTGIKPKRAEIKLLKFWFDKDGKYIATTAVDGLVKKYRNGSERTKTTRSTGRTSFSSNLDDYDVVKINLSFSDIYELSTGDFVYFTNNEGRSGVAYVYRSGGNVYFLQNFASGSSPTSGNWYSIASNSWIIGSPDDYRVVNLLKLKTEKPELKEEIDPYTWNTTTNIRRGSLQLGDSSIFSEVKNAHFAIILDFGKLKKSGYEPKSDIVADRDERKSGATALMSDEDIRKVNLNRYMDEITKRSDIVSNISNVDKVAKRMLGGNLVLFLALGQRSRFYQDFTSLIENYYYFVDCSEEEKEYYLKRLNDNIKSNYNRVSKSVENINNGLKTTKLKLKNNNDNPNYLKMIEKIEEISKLTYQRFSDIKLETIEDLEVFARKLQSIREIAFSSRYKVSKLQYVFNYLDSERVEQPYRYLTDHYYTSNPSEILDSLNILESLINKLV